MGGGSYFLGKVGVHAGIIWIALEILALKKRLDGLFDKMGLGEETLIQLACDLRRGILM